MTSYSQTLTSFTVINNRVQQSLVEDVLLNFLRNNLTDRQDRTLSNSETFTSNGTNTYELTGDKDNKGRHKVMNIISLTVDNIAQTFLKDYKIGIRNDDPLHGKIYFWNAPINGSIINVSYNYAYNMIFTETPRINLNRSVYPTVSLQVDTTSFIDIAIGGGVTKKDIDITLTIIDTKKTYVETIAEQIINLFLKKETKNGFYYFDYIRLVRETPVIPNGEDPNDVVYMKQVELEIPNVFEFSGGIM